MIIQLTLGLKARLRFEGASGASALGVIFVSVKASSASPSVIARPTTSSSASQSCAFYAFASQSFLFSPDFEMLMTTAA